MLVESYPGLMNCFITIVLTTSRKHTRAVLWLLFSLGFVRKNTYRYVLICKMCTNCIHKKLSRIGFKWFFVSAPKYQNVFLKKKLQLFTTNHKQKNGKKLLRFLNPPNYIKQNSVTCYDFLSCFCSSSFNQLNQSCFLLDMTKIS